MGLLPFIVSAVSYPAKHNAYPAWALHGGHGRCVPPVPTECGGTGAPAMSQNEAKTGKWP